MHVKIKIQFPPPTVQAYAEFHSYLCDYKSSVVSYTGISPYRYT